MIWIGIVIGAILGTVVGLGAYHFFVFKKAQEKWKTEKIVEIAAERDKWTTSELSKFEEEKLNELKNEIELKRKEEFLKVHQMAAEELATLRESYSTIKETEETSRNTMAELRREEIAIRGRIGTLKDELIAAQNDSNAFDQAVGSLYASALSDEKRKLNIELAQYKLSLASEREALRVTMAADEENARAYHDQVEECAEKAKLIYAKCSALVNGDEPGYRLHLTEAAVFELSELWRSIKGLRLPNPAPLYKACFEMYLRGPIKEAFSGIAPGGGIYCITDTTTGLAYVGKTTDFKERWLTHIKRGGYYEEGTAAGSTLYSAMKEHGVWNFRFEVLQAVEDESKLGELEKWWIEKLGTVKNGLNMKVGG